jgi:hypothetical protein
MVDSQDNSTIVQPIEQDPAPDTSMAAGLMWMHALFFWMAVVVIGLSFVMRTEGPTSVYFPGTSVSLPELCSSKRMFGLPCPGCGLTRSFISISHGQLGRAWNFNPASFFLYAFVAIQIPWNAMQFLLIRSRKFGITLPYIHFLPITVAVVLVANWLIRLSFWQV